MKNKNHYFAYGDCEETLEWFNYFVDYIQEIDSNLYNQACEYADNMHPPLTCCNEEITDEIKDQGRCPECKENI